MAAHRAVLSQGESLSDGSCGQTALKKAAVLEPSLAALKAERGFRRPVQLSGSGGGAGGAVQGLFHFSGSGISGLVPK